MIIKKDSDIVKAKGERKSLALKVKKKSNDEESSTSESEDEEFAMRVRDFKNVENRRGGRVELFTVPMVPYIFGGRVAYQGATSRGKFVRQPRNDKRTFQRSLDDKNVKSDMKRFTCGDPNHLIGECPKPPRDKNQKAFVGGSWSDSGEEDDEKAKDETCLMAHASSEGFAAALAVLITRASQSRQHGMSKPARRSLID
uniref:Alpha/beta hydrolases superfamily protein n=1 Tax=Tanacetum cinerariifolium TaxID=118510 RepID=A0A6L2J7D1_TANCI|nr:hypothetical protein [Tanacetum cinerariifolium]